MGAEREAYIPLDIFSDEPACREGICTGYRLRSQTPTLKLRRQRAEVIVLRRKTSHHPKGQGWRSRKTEEGLNPESSTGLAVYLPEIELGEHSLAHYEIRE